MFNNTNRPAGNIFGGNQQQRPQGNIFGANQQQGNNIFGANQQQQPQNNMFNNQQQQPNPIFANQQQQPQNNIFATNQTNQNKPTIFGAQQQTGQQQGPNIFGGNQQQQPQNNIFGANQQQQGNNIFTANQQQPQQQQGPNIFGGNQQQQGSNTLTNQMNPQMYGQQPLLQTSWPSNQSQTQQIRIRIQECCRRVDPKNLEYIKIDEMNMFKDTRIGDLPVDIKNSIIVIMNNMKELRGFVDGIKRENENLDKLAVDYCKKVQEKLVKYKEVLIQNIQQSNLLDEVKKEIELIETQVNSVIIPLYNAHKSGKHQSFDSPDQFSSTIARKVLQKMIELNNKVDEIISCQQQGDSESISEQDANTLMVLEQLLNYYENVSAKVLEFTNRYNAIKNAQIDRNKRSSSYEDVMRRIQDKVDNKMKKDFKCYDLIKEIEDILAKREKRQEDYRDKNVDRKRTLQFNDDYSQGWARYGSTY